MEEVFEPVNTKQVESNEKQLQAIDKQTQGVTQAIENQTRAIEHNNNTLQKSIKEGKKQYNEITNRQAEATTKANAEAIAELHNQLLTSLANSNQVDCSIVKTVSNLPNDKNKSQFSLEPITQDNPNLFTVNPHNPQPVLIKGSTMIFENGNSYDLSNPDLQYFITNTQFDKPINSWVSIYTFLNDMKYDLDYGDKKSIRYQFIEELYSHYQLQTQDLQGFAQGSSQPQSSMDNTQGNQLGSQSGSQLGSGLNGEAAQGCARSYARNSTQQYIFLPSDPDELVDQLKLLYFEKVGENDSILIIEQIVAIIDKLMDYECISPSQHQNIRSNLLSKFTEGEVAVANAQ